MKTRRTAREMELAAVGGRGPKATPWSPPQGEAAAMLARRGFHGEAVRPDVPFVIDIDDDAKGRILDHLGNYAFRLFLRGAIQRGDGFAPEETTRYLTAAQAEKLATRSVELGLAERLPDGRFRLIHRPKSFGGTLEWYVAHELRRRLGFDVLVGRTFPAPGVGGDLDVVAAAEGKLVYLEVKSSPPKHIAPPEVAAFFERVRTLRPDISIFVVDTALRLSDRVIPMLCAELLKGGREGEAPPLRCVERELWALSPHIFAVNAKPDLAANIGRAVAEGIRALSPEPP